MADKKKYAVGYIGKQGMRVYYFGHSECVESVLAEHKTSENIYSETYTVRYYSDENGMMNYINERRNFLDDAGGIEFYNLSEVTQCKVV